MLSAGIEPKVYIIFVLLGIALLLHNVNEIRPVVVNMGNLGLSSYLTISYWIGFILVILFSVALFLDKKEKSDSIYLIYLIAVELFLFGVSTFTEENARFSYSYYPAGEVKTVIDTKSISHIDEYPVQTYYSWPGTHVISTFMIYFTGISVDNLIKYMPIFWTFILIFVTYNIGKLIKLKANQCFMISFLVLSSFWTMNYYYGPPSVAYILYLLFFVSIILMYRMDNNEYGDKYYNKYLVENVILMVLVFISVVITHMLTSITLIVAFLSASRFIFSYMRQLFPSIIEEPTGFLYQNSGKFLILFIAIFIGWHAYFTPSVFNMGTRDLMRQITEGTMFSVFQSEKYSFGTTLTRQVIHYSRIAYMVIYAIIMTIATIIYAKGGIKDEYKKFIKICYLWFAGVLIILSFRYGAEIDDRVYMFSLVPMALIIIMTFSNRTIAVLAVVLIAFHLPAHYGTESYDMVYTTELKGSEFISKINNYDTINYYYGSLIKYYSPEFAHSNRKGVGYDQGIYNPDDKSLDQSTYIIDSKQMSNYLLYIYGVDKIPVYLQKGDKLGLLYDNGYYSVYKR